MPSQVDAAKLRRAVLAPARLWVRGVLIFFGIMTVCTALAAVFQLSDIRPLEASHCVPGYVQTEWASDKAAVALRIGLVKPEVVSWAPRIVVLQNFLSEEECRQMVQLGAPQLQLSTVVDVATGKGIRSKMRTSSGMFLNQWDRRHAFVRDIEKRISVFSMVPEENGELLQILRYEPDQQYRPHHDFFVDEFNLKRGGQRVATLLMYIREPQEGGETIFPLAGNGQCLCGGVMQPGLCVPSKLGTAVLFWSQKLDGTTDDSSLHGSCPVIKGEKWSSTKWMRQGVFT